MMLAPQDAQYLQCLHQRIMRNREDMHDMCIANEPITGEIGAYYDEHQYIHHIIKTMANPFKNGDYTLIGLLLANMQHQLTSPCIHYIQCILMVHLLNLEKHIAPHISLLSALDPPDQIYISNFIQYQMLLEKK